MITKLNKHVLKTVDYIWVKAKKNGAFGAIAAWLIPTLTGPIVGLFRRGKK